LIEYFETHSVTTFLLAVCVLLAPFFFRWFLKVLWSIFGMLGQFIFKDRFRAFMRNRIAGILRSYVNENLDIGDMPQYQANMITLYSLYWHSGNVRVEINMAEIRVELGTTIRQYLKLWLRSWFSSFDYHKARTELLCSCIKDVRLYRCSVEVNVPVQSRKTDQAITEKSEQQGKRSYSLADLRKLKLNIAFESGEILLKIGSDEFLLQNFFGMAENIPTEAESQCSVRFSGIYEGDNVTLNSLDNNLEHFMVMVNSLRLTDRVWHALANCCVLSPGDIKVKDGKFLDVRLVLGCDGRNFAVEKLSAKMEEGAFACGRYKVEDLEFSVYSPDLAQYDVKKLALKLNEHYINAKGILFYRERFIHSERIEGRFSGTPVAVKNFWVNLATKQYGGEMQFKVVEDAKNVLADWQNKLKSTVNDKIKGMIKKIKIIDKGAR